MEDNTKLQRVVHDLNAVTTVQNILANGLFRPKHFDDVKVTQSMLAKLEADLHKQALQLEAKVAPPKDTEDDKLHKDYESSIASYLQNPVEQRDLIRKQAVEHYRQRFEDQQ